MTRDVASIPARRAISTDLLTHIMSEVLNSSADVAVQATNVRAELKVWEKAFASANGGKKAGRDDIKQNAEIGRSNSNLLLGTDLTPSELQPQSTRSTVV